MEEEMLFSVWEPLLETGGQAVTAVALATNTYLKVKKSIVGASPLENALNTQLPMALDKTGMSLFTVHQDVSETVNQLCPMGRIKEEMHQGKLSKQEKIDLWGQLFKGSVGLLLFAPYLAAAESICLALRSVSCVLIHHEMEGKGNTNAGGLGDLMGGGATGALLNTMMAKMLNTVGTTPFLEEITAESDDAITAHIERVVAPSVIRIAFEAVEKHFKTEEWVLTEPVTHDKFASCFEKARKDFEEGLCWGELFHGLVPVSQHASPVVESPTGPQVEEVEEDEEVDENDERNGETGSSPHPKQQLQDQTDEKGDDQTATATNDDKVPQLRMAPSQSPLSPSNEELRDTVSYQQRTRLREYMAALIASDSFDSLVLDSTDRSIAATITALKNSYCLCKSYKQEEKSALLLHVILHVEKHANGAADKAPELSKLTQKFCSELLKSSM